MQPGVAVHYSQARRDDEFEEGGEGGEGAEAGDNLDFGEDNNEGVSGGGAAPRANRKGAAAGSFPWSGTDRYAAHTLGPVIAGYGAKYPTPPIPTDGRDTLHAHCTPLVTPLTETHMQAVAGLWLLK